MEKLKRLQHEIGYRFRKSELLSEAFTHNSYDHEKHIGKNYQRLEVLGDAVLELVVTEYLLNKYPDMKEGSITKLRASLVCEKALAVKARSLKLNEYVRLGKGEMTNANRDSLLCDLVESLIGAIYSDGGMVPAKALIHEVILSDHSDPLFIDYKTQLQEALGARENELRYILIEEHGPDHDKTFIMAAFFDDKEIGRGAGHSRKEAEQQAAAQAIKVLQADA